MASNWLRKLDVGTRRLPRAANWLNYSPFMFARYPRLQPRGIRSDRYVRSHVETGREIFNRELSTWEARIRDHELARRVFERLKPTQSRQLASLVYDTVLELEEHKARQDKRKLFIQISQGGKRHLRKAERLVAGIGKSLEALSQLASELHPEMGREDFKSAAVHAQNALAPLTRHRTAEFWRNRRNAFGELVASTSLPKGLNSELMVWLYSFFRHGCRLSARESEVRVALLRNAFWTEFGVIAISYQAAYQAGESKGCVAVRQAVRRWQLKPGTSY